MTIKLLFLFWGISFLAFAIYAPFRIYDKFKKGESFEVYKYYSYSEIIKSCGSFALFSIIISVLIYIETKSLEIPLTIFIFLVALTVAMVISGLVFKRTKQPNETNNSKT